MLNNPETSQSLEIKAVTKSFGDRLVLNELSLTIPASSILFLVGPSGCGKSTLLRLITGLESVDSGDILLGERSIAEVPPAQRGIGLVFQNYALWPHLTVKQHLMFALQQQQLSAEQRETRCSECLELVELTEHSSTLPGQLSGGQQQRLALARSLVLRPHVLLLDEPFSNLDLKLRRQVMSSLREIQKKFNMTLVIVAHDIEAVIQDNDLIVTMNNGTASKIAKYSELAKAGSV